MRIGVLHAAAKLAPAGYVAGDDLIAGGAGDQIAADAARVVAAAADAIIGIQGAAFLANALLGEGDWGYYEDRGCRGFDYPVIFVAWVHGMVSKTGSLIIPLEVQGEVEVSIAKRPVSGGELGEILHQ